MSPTLAERLEPLVAKIHESLESDREIAEVLASEAQAWMQEQLTQDVLWITRMVQR